MDNKLNIPKIRVNAEFQRLLWLNASWGMAAGIIILYALFVFAKPYETDTVGYIAGIGAAGVGISGVAIYILIGRSLRQDVSSNTFDQLRMSSLSPWQMVYARIVAAPLSGWIIFAAGWLLCGLAMLHPDGRSSEGLAAWLVLPLDSWAVACLILVNALQFKRGSHQWEGSLLQLLLLFIVIMNFVGSLFAAVEAADLEMKIGVFGGVDVVSSSIVYAVVSAVLCSVAACSAMAQRLHLRPSRLTFTLVGLSAPLAFAGTLPGYRDALFILALVYGTIGIVSLLTQNQQNLTDAGGPVRSGSRTPVQTIASLPAWMFLLPLGLLGASLLSLDVALAYLQIFLLMLLVFSMSKIQWRFNSITVTLVIFLLLRGLWLLAR